MKVAKVAGMVWIALLVCGWAASVDAATDEIDRGAFKMLYSRDTQVVHRKAVALKALAENPRAYLNLPIKVRVRFHRVEKGLFVPEFTPFGPESHISFSAWDAGSPLWSETVMKEDFPFMFVEKDTGAAQDLVRLRQFDIVEIFGEVVSLFEDKPWFEVTRIWLEKKSPLTTTLFSHIRLAEDMYEKGMYDLCVGELDRILGYELSADLAAMLYKRKGESLLIQNKYPEAAEAFAQSAYYSPEDAEVFKGWGTALMQQGEYAWAFQNLENSLVYHAKQAPVYARMGYCRAKMADALIKQLSVDEDAIQALKPEDIRRRDKQVRDEYDPGRLGVTAKIRERITEEAFLDIIKTYDLAILDCRKALFIDPTLTSALDWQQSIEKRLAAFKDKYKKPEEPVKPAEKPADPGKK